MPTPRSGHVEAPQLPTGSFQIEPPPDIVEGQGLGNSLAMILPMVGSMGIMVFMAMSNSSNPRMLMMAGAMVVAMLSMVGFAIYRQISQHRNKVVTTRREYLAYLSELRADVRRFVADQRRFMTWNLPEPLSLPLLVQQGQRLWERTDPDSETFLLVRVGRRPQPLASPLVEPELGPLADADPVCLSAVSRFVKTFREIQDLPVGVDVGQYASVEVAGEREISRQAATSILLSLTTMVGPELLKVAVVGDQDALTAWDWVKWLPHAHSHEEDAVGGMRTIGGSIAEVRDLLPEDVFERGPFHQRDDSSAVPQVVLVVDGVRLSASEREDFRRDGVCVIELLDSWGKLTDYVTLRLLVGPDPSERVVMNAVSLAEPDVGLIADQVPAATALSAARRMARYVGVESSSDSEGPTGKLASDPTRSADLLELLNLGDVRDFDPAMQVVRREGRSRLNVPFGVTPEGVPVLLDIKENAQQGMGPHGLLIGATGSGKSEVLRTIVLALVMTHSPEQLNLVLVDFKGGATFAGMSDLPHVSATITNLESELTLVDRMEEALHGEMVRRQELLRRAGNYANVREYETERLQGKHQYEPLPALFIILDEFSELLSAKPDFINTFVAIGRLGRSLEIHLLLSTQKLEESKLRGLESHLSYRIGLRTFSAQDSRAVLGTPDAFTLPTVPGVGYLKTAGEGMVQFRASYVAAEPKARKMLPSASGARRQSAARILPFSASPVLQRQDLASIDREEVEFEKEEDAQWKDMSILEIAVEKLKPLTPKAHQVWLPPLEESPSLDALFPDLTVTAELGLHSPSGRQRNRLMIPLGIKDVPREQRREDLLIDLSAGAGHLAVLGGPQSGKSTTLRSVVLALSLLNTPQEVQFYIMDFGGGTFAGFDGGLHVAAVATRDRVDVISRVLAEVTTILDDRERYFREHRIDSMATYRRGRAEGRYDDGYGDVFLIIDGWHNMKADFMDMDRTIQDMSGRALGLGVHLLVGSPRMTDLRHAMQGIFGSIVEMRMGEPRDSVINFRAAERVPEDKPGNALTQSEHQALIALPRIDGSGDADSIADGIQHAWKTLRQSWSGAPGPKLKMLPQMLTLDEVRQMPAPSGGILLGINEARLEPVSLDFGSTDHLYVFGDTKKGKSSFLRLIAQETMRLHEPHEAQFFVVDFRRSLLQQIPEVYQAGYYSTHEVATAAMAEVASWLSTRLPDSSVTPQQLRDRSWWDGPEAYLLIDDYDLVHTSRGNPLAPIVELLPQARDVGLHVIVARRSGGASRALFDPLIRGIADLGNPALLLPGNPNEGALVDKVKPRPGPAGRAQFVSREEGLQILQVAYAPDTVN